MSEALQSQRLAKPIFWGVAVGLIQAFSPLGLWWLEPTLVWSLALVVIASDGEGSLSAEEIEELRALAERANGWIWTGHVDEHLPRLVSFQEWATLRADGQRFLVTAGPLRSNTSYRHNKGAFAGRTRSENVTL